jgi:hypothetical protein
MSNFENSDSSKQISDSKQSSQQENFQINSSESSENIFFRNAFELIQALSNSFSSEDITKTIYNFIEISVNFWKKVIPPQNEETKYSMEALSEGVEYFSNLINQHN